MLRIQVLLSMLGCAFAVALALLKPLPARAASGGEAPPAADSIPVSTTPMPQPLPVVAPKRVRTPQFHIPLGSRVVKFARKLVGTRYVYGGSSPRTGFDCSGFVRYVYAHFGLSLPHSSYAQFSLGRRVARKALRPGDLVFFDGLGHVGMYVGHGRFIHAPHTGTRVRVETLAGWYGSRFVGARRLRPSS
jgi:cell wall-associated NlpC family hydrolase